MKIALFGGAFDPPHLGHKLVADSLISNKIVDEVWFVPVFQHPWADRYGKRELASYEHRIEMLELSIASSEFANSQKVMHFKSVSFTYDTLDFFRKKFLEHTFSWVMGSEYLDRFDDFLKGHPRLSEFQFYVYPRAGYSLDEDFKKENMIFLDGMAEIEASSTEVKQRIRGNIPVSQLINPSVEEFIIKNSTY